MIVLLCLALTGVLRGSVALVLQECVCWRCLGSVREVRRWCSGSVSVGAASVV